MTTAELTSLQRGAPWLRFRCALAGDADRLVVADSGNDRVVPWQL